MPELKLSQKTKNKINAFVNKLIQIYSQELVAVVLYGSAASGEFADKHSNINLLVVLKNTDLATLAKANTLVNSRKFKNISSLFFTEEYIRASTDVFPIEFLDMKENYALLQGKDVLKDIDIDFKNLRFQCEHELKAKLIMLKQSYLRLHKDKNGLRNVLFKSFTSVMHLLRNVLRIKGREPAYLKTEIIKQINQELGIDTQNWNKVWSAKSGKITLTTEEVGGLYRDFISSLEKVTDLVDKL